MVVDLAAAMFGFLMEKRENWSLLWWLMLQRFGYRQLMYYVVVRSISTALGGAFVSWGKLERAGTVQAAPRLNGSARDVEAAVIVFVIEPISARDRVMHVLAQGIGRIGIELDDREMARLDQATSGASLRAPVSNCWPTLKTSTAGGFARPVAEWTAFRTAPVLAAPREMRCPFAPGGFVAHRMQPEVRIAPRRRSSRRRKAAAGRIRRPRGAQLRRCAVLSSSKAVPSASAMSASNSTFTSTPAPPRNPTPRIVPNAA